jgi:hypothetical protein
MEITRVTVAFTAAARDARTVLHAANSSTTATTMS